MERVKIIHKISDIIERRCKGCKLFDESGAGTDGAKRKKVCDKCQYGIELKSLGDQLNGNRKGKTRMMNEKKKPGRPKKEPMNTIKKEDDYNKLAYEIKAYNQRMKQLETELAEKDKLIKLKTEDQAQLMKENGDLRKDNDLYKEANEVKKEKIQELEEKLKRKEENHKDVCEMLKMRHIHEEAELENKYKGDLSAYKEKIVKAEGELESSKADNRKLLKEKFHLEEHIDSIVVNHGQEPAPTNENELITLSHKVDCLERTLMCYMPNNK